MGELRLPLCYVEGCERPLRGHGYCIGHYREAREQDWPIPHPRRAAELRRIQRQQPAGEQLSMFLETQPPAGRRRCFFCTAHQITTSTARHLDEPHDGPCGRPCFGGAPMAEVMSLEGEALDDYVLSHHLDRGCLHCGEERDTPCAA